MFIKVEEMLMATRFRHTVDFILEQIENKSLGKLSPVFVPNLKVDVTTSMKEMLDNLYNKFSAWLNKK